MLPLLQATIAVLLQGAVTLANTPAPSSNYDVDIKRYSYICMKDNQDLCLGISPGDGYPFFDPNVPPFSLQLKQRLNNEQQALDYKKTRWDVRFQEDIISLSRFPDLCISLQALDKSQNTLALYPCTEVQGNKRLGKWDMKFNTNINEMSTIQMFNDSVCITAMACNSGSSGFCDPSSQDVAVDGKYRTGAYVKTKPCWWSPSGSPSWQAAQTFVQAIDCAVGCSPMLQNNDVCDLACANSQCKLDNGKCVTAAPTPPTPRPSTAPTTPEPTTATPTTAPVTHGPTTSPTNLPTKPPTSQAPSGSPTPKPTKMPTTLLPSKAPVTDPTKRPTSFAPSRHPITQKPSGSPTLTPSAEPTFSPTMTAPSATPSMSPVVVPVLKADPPSGPEPLNAAAVVGVAVPSLLFLLLCLVGFIVVRQRKKRVKRDLTAWNSPIGVNQAAFVEHHKNQKPSIWTRMTAPFRRQKPESPAITALSSSALPVDDIVVVGAPSWQPTTVRPSRSRSTRPKLTGS